MAYTIKSENTQQNPGIKLMHFLQSKWNLYYLNCYRKQKQLNFVNSNMS